MAMATPKEAFDLVAERKGQLRKVFTEFEAKKFSLGRIGSTWKDLEEHFKEIETCLDKTHDAYKSKEKAFEDRIKSSQAELEKLDAEVSAKEQASVSRVQSQKGTAVSSILEQKRKLADEKRKWEVEKQRFESGGLEALVSQKEAYSKKQGNTLNASAYTKDGPAAAAKVAAGKKQEDVAPKKGTIQDEKASPKVHREPRPKLRSICANMDANEFRKFIVENQKELRALQEEIPSALKICSDPAHLVLKTIEGYLEPDKKIKRDFSKDDCFACSMLLECLSELLGNNPVSAKLRKVAKSLSDKWKALLKLDGQINFNVLLLGRSFLLFVATFGLSNEYNQDELCEIVAKVARRKQTAILFRSLGLSDKAPDVIERLVKESRYIEAVAFISEFNLFDRFPPAPLLKSHVTEAKSAANTLSKNGNNTLAVQNEALQKELGALKAVSTIVRECKLEDHFNMDEVDKQIASLEQTKTERKRVATVSKSQQPPKKPRTDDGSPTDGRSSPPLTRPLQGLHDRDLFDRGRVPPSQGAVMMPDLKTRLPIGEFDRKPLGDFDRRLLGEYERRQMEDIERRRLGLPDPAYGASSRGPANYGQPSLGLSSLGYKSSVSNGHPVYGYSALPSLGMGPFKPYL